MELMEVAYNRLGRAKTNNRSEAGQRDVAGGSQPPTPRVREWRRTSLFFLDRLEVVEQSVDRPLNGGLALAAVFFVSELEAQPPQRHRTIEVVMPGQALAAVDDVVNLLAREFLAVVPSRVSKNTVGESIILSLRRDRTRLSCRGSAAER
jgi:hypothetical protein